MKFEVEKIKFSPFAEPSCSSGRLCTRRTRWAGTSVNVRRHERTECQCASRVARKAGLRMRFQHRQDWRERPLDALQLSKTVRCWTVQDLRLEAALVAAREQRISDRRGSDLMRSKHMAARCGWACKSSSVRSTSILLTPSLPICLRRSSTVVVKSAVY